MSPLDDELRSTLSSRTESVAPSPDFFDGVERRARRMRRNRVAGAVAGSALAVSALGLGGPMLASSLTSTAPGPLDQATSAPTALPDARFVLDPAAPWPYRGVPLKDLGDGTVEAVRVQLAATRGVWTDDVELTPLYGRRAGDPQQLELLFVAQVGGTPSWGVARTGEAGPEIVQETALLAGTVALAAALPDGEGGVELLVLTSPEARRIEYSAGLDADPDDWQRTVVLGAGVGAIDLIPNSRDDRYRVLDRRGGLLVDTRAPEPVIAGGGPSAVEPPA